MTNLNYEIDTWNTNGSSYVWVQVPALVGNATITAWWGGAGQTTPTAGTTKGATWTNGYVGVWHMKEGAGTSTSDSTTNADNGTLQASPTWVNGVVGKGVNFNGTSQYISVPQNGKFNLSQTAFTISCWCSNNVPTTTSRMFSWYDGKSNVQLVCSSSGYFSIVNGNAASKAYTTFSGSAGRHVVATFDGSTYKMYVNGVDVTTAGSDGGSYGLFSTATTLYLGQRGDGAAFLAGALDESRISRVARSANWVWAECLNMASNGVFNSYGAVQFILPKISDSVSQNVSAQSADVVGSLITNGLSAATVYLCYATNDCTTNVANWAALGTLTNVGTFTSGAVFTNTLSGLAPNTSYYWNLMASNAEGVAWGATAGSPSFKTFGPPAVNNGVGATGVSYFQATLNGNLTNGVNAHIYAYLGTQDGVWTITNDFATINEGSFSNTVVGLSPATTYYYAFYATNAYGSALATPSASFTTFTNHTYYVTSTGNGNASGTNWANAFSNVQSAINAAVNYVAPTVVGSIFHQ